jgi:small redox-active disulfide protein 2
MKKIIVYGPGCPTCIRCEELVRKVVSECGDEALVNKVTDLKAMVEAGVMSTPAVAVDGVIKSAGRVPKAEEIREWLGHEPGREHEK